MPKPYPKEFREDVVRVALNRDESTTIAQIGADGVDHDVERAEVVGPGPPVVDGQIGTETGHEVQGARAGEPRHRARTERLRDLDRMGPDSAATAVRMRTILTFLGMRRSCTL